MIRLDRPALVVYVLFALLIMAPLLRPGYYLALDMQFGPNSFTEWHFLDLYGLEPSSYGAYLPVKLVLAALSTVFGVEAVEKLFLLSILLLCGISMHSSLPEEHGFARYFAGLLYMLNPFVFVRFLAGHWSLLLSYALWPFAILSFHRFLEAPKDRKALVTAAILTTLSAVSSHGAIMLFLAYGLLFLSHTLRKGIDASSAKMLAVLALLVLIMNLYWIAPTALMFNSVYRPASAESYFKDFGPLGDGMTPGAALATMHGFWREGFKHTKDVSPLWPLLFVLIAALAIYGFTALLKERALHAFFLAAVFLAGLLLALGPASPLVWIFSLFGDSFPLQMIFRDSQKFVGLLCLAYATLGSYGAHRLLENSGCFKALLFAGIFLLPILYNFGFFGLLGQIWPTSYPVSWHDAEAIMAADQTEGRLLVLPSALYNVYPWVIGSQRTLATPASQFFSREVVSETAVLTPNVHGDTDDPRGDYLRYLFDERQFINDTAELMLPLGVRYVMIFKGSEDADHHLWLFKRRGGVANFSLVYESDDIYLLRNDLIQGLLFSSGDPGEGGFEPLLGSVGQGMQSPEVSYQRLTPSTYRIEAASLRYAVFAVPSTGFMRFEGQPLSSWHRLGGAFEPEAPGMLYNMLFPLTLGLFLLAWCIGLALLLGLDLPRAAALALPAAAIFFLVSDGSIHPAGLGILFTLSILLSLAARYAGTCPMAAAVQKFFKH